MDVISTHIHADFDALASMVAAAKLYPKARLLFPGSQERNVREFLQETRFPLPAERLKGFPIASIARLILVDVKRGTRIGPLREILGRPGLDVHIYDHHPAHPKDIAGSLEVLREVGATTTILLGLLRDQEAAITPQEATLFALGIYEETGFLTFTNTTEADSARGGVSVCRGANLTLVADFIRRELTAVQVGLLNELIRSAETHTVNGVRVVISTASLDRYVGDLAMLTHKLRDMENINVLFTLVRMDNRVHLVARSRLEVVDVSRIVEPFGGGGHATAASATIKDLTLFQVKERLLGLLREVIRPLKRARDIMMAPVKAIPERFTIRGAAEIMNRFNLAHLPVVRRGDMVGLITREVVDKAIFHGLGGRGGPRVHERGVRARDARDTSLRGAAADGGAEPGLPARVGGAAAARGGDAGGPAPLRLRGSAHAADVLDLGRPGAGRAGRAQRRQPPGQPSAGRIQSLLRSAGAVADEVGTRIYAVGGFVRDLLLRHENLDVDLVVEGDGIAFAERLGRRLTAKVTEPPEVRHGGSHPSRRIPRWTWPRPARNTTSIRRPCPTVEHSSIKMDLYRRDFTVNALAVCLNGDRYGELLDFFGGQQDLRDKTLRIIHNLSFVEDPTRILRAARFEVRFGLHLSRHAEQFSVNAVQMGLLDKVAGPRVFTELQSILREPRPWAILQRLEALGALAAIHPRFALGRTTEQRFQRVGEVLTWYALLYLPTQPAPWLVYFLVLLEERPGVEARAILRRLSPPAKMADAVARDLAPASVAGAESPAHAGGRAEPDVSLAGGGLDGGRPGSHGGGRPPGASQGHRRFPDRQRPRAARCCAATTCGRWASSRARCIGTS